MPEVWGPQSPRICRTVHCFRGDRAGLAPRALGRLEPSEWGCRPPASPSVWSAPVAREVPGHVVSCRRPSGASTATAFHFRIFCLQEGAQASLLHTTRSLGPQAPGPPCLVPPFPISKPLRVQSTLLRGGFLSPGSPLRARFRASPGGEEGRMEQHVGGVGHSSVLA